MAAATPSSYGRPSVMNGSASSTHDPMTARRSFLDASALSPQEYIVYLSSLASIKPAPSGQPGLIDEQDALRYLRDECGMVIADELEILALFERTPLGLASGHLFAMLRLVSWAQQGRSATKDLIFTQTNPARITHSAAAAPQSASPAEIQQQHTSTSRSISVASAPRTPKVAPPKPDSSTKPHLTPVREEAQPSFQSPGGSKPPTVPAKPQMPQLIAPKPKVANPNIPINLEELHRKPVPVPPSTSANPFRDNTAATTYISGSGYAVAVGATSTTPANIPAPTGALLGFDPAPNPFKQSKPRIVKPTPVRASSPASNPFRYGTPGTAAQSQFPKVVFDPVDDAESSQASSSRSRPQHQADRLGATSPPLPSRTAGGDRNPPPLPPRHISPLIQAGLNARSQVRRAQESLPPKTFTVLQSSTLKHGGLAPKKPRLLTGQAAPPELAQLGHHGKKRSISGNKAFMAAMANAAAGGESRKSFSEGHTLHRRDSQQSHSDQGRGAETDLAMAARRTSSQLHRRAESEAGGAASSVLSHGPQRSVHTVAPKPIYAKKAGSGGGGEESVPSIKPNLPSWLKEQEQLQREALESGSEPMPPPEIKPTEGGVRGRASRTVIDDLNDSADAMSQQVAAAANAASIERNNPFFPPHAREATVESSVGYDAERETQDDSQVSSNRPLERSKTVSSAHRPPPTRRRVIDSESASDDNTALYGHSLDAGLHAGFKPNKEPKNSGGLRLVPPSKQAKMLNVTGSDLEQEGIRPAQDLRKVSGNSGSGTQSHTAGVESENSSANGPLSPTTPSGTYPSHTVLPSGFMRRQGSLGTTIREKVSDILRLQEQPPKGQRQVDLLGQDIANFVNKNEWLARKRDSLVRTGSGAARDRERLLASEQADGDKQGASSHDDDYQRNSNNYAIHDDEDDEGQTDDNDEPHPDTDPALGGRHSMQSSRSTIRHQRNTSGGSRDPFSSPPPIEQRQHYQSQTQYHQQQHQQHLHGLQQQHENAHEHQPPPQHPSGVRRSGSLTNKRAMSYNYPANVTVLSSTSTHSREHGASAAAPPSIASAAAAAAAAVAAAAGSGSRRWSSFHHPENKFNQLHSQTPSHSSREDAISAWRDLRGSAVDEEDADIDAPVPPLPTSAPATGYVQF